MNEIYKTLSELIESRESAALCTVIRASGSTPRHTSSKMLVYPSGKIAGTIGGGELERQVISEAQRAIKDEKPRLLEYLMNDPKRGDVGVCGGKMEIFVEPVLPSPTMIIIGCGHVGKAVAHLAKWLGFFVVVSDDRKDLCTPEKNPSADEVIPVPMGEIPRRIKITNNTYFILTTRGTSIDVEGLPALMNTSAAYFGIIGSKKRWAETRDGLKKAGVPEGKINTIHSPIGLSLGAETPEEIAVSIIAQIIMLRNSRSGTPTKLEKK